MESIIRLIKKPPKRNKSWDANNPRIDESSAPYRIFNIGNGAPVELMKYIHQIEKSLGRKGIYNFMEIQPGDVPATHADTRALEEYIGFKPNTTIEEGIQKFIDWYKSSYIKKE